MKNKKVILYILAFSLTLSMFIFPAHAVDVYETENNNTVTNADVTYDDYNNYGAISSAADVDWWTITVTQTGSANFWMGNVPSGCHYNLYLYEFDGEVLIAQSTVAEDGQLINARVYAGVTYTIKIASTGGYSSANYIFRIKNYTDARKARFFSFDDNTQANANFRMSFNVAAPIIRTMGYTAGESYDFIAASVGANVPNYDLVNLVSHAEPGEFYCQGYTRLYGKNYYLVGASDYCFNDYAYGALSRIKLLVLTGCESAATDSSGYKGNLCSEAKAKSPHCVLGWETEITEDDVILWMEEFYTQLANGVNVGEASEEVESIMESEALYSEEINSIKGWGDLYSLTLN